jgi:hypothetical protein
VLTGPRDEHARHSDHDRSDHDRDDTADQYPDSRSPRYFRARERLATTVVILGHRHAFITTMPTPNHAGRPMEK